MTEKGTIMNTRKLLISIVLAASLALGAGTALAQNGDSQPADPPGQGQGFRGPRGPMMGEGFQHRFGPQGEGAQAGPHGPMMGPQGQFGPRGPMMGVQGGGALHGLVEEYTGLDHAALHAARLSGQTLAELIEANGQSVDAFTAAAAEAVSARIDALLANGAITAERAEELKALVQERLTTMLNSEMGGGLRMMFGWT